jgi:hypothetical protein
VLVLLWATVAAAKGPTALTITGEGLDGPIEIGAAGGSGEPGGGGQMSRLAEHTGLFATMFGATGSELDTQRPAGDLGPALTLTWTVPMGDLEAETLVQRLYPWAEVGPVTHTEGGQAHAGHRTVGGWYTGGQQLAGVLAEAGVPQERPGAGSTRAALGVGGMIAAGLLLLGAQRLARRRSAVALAA